jgi:hypothetical protein
VILILFFCLEACLQSSSGIACLLAYRILRLAKGPGRGRAQRCWVMVGGRPQHYWVSMGRRPKRCWVLVKQSPTLFALLEVFWAWFVNQTQQHWVRLPKLDLAPWGREGHAPVAILDSTHSKGMPPGMLQCRPQCKYSMAIVSSTW